VTRVVRVNHTGLEEISKKELKVSVMGKIDWDNLLDGDFISIEAGVAKRMVCTNWRPQTKFFRDDAPTVLTPGLHLDVVNEDGEALPKVKEWTLTAMKGLKKLRPIIEKAEALGQSLISVSVVKAGTGKSTVYEITEVPMPIPAQPVAPAAPAPAPAAPAPAQPAPLPPSPQQPAAAPPGTQ